MKETFAFTFPVIFSSIIAYIALGMMVRALGIYRFGTAKNPNLNDEEDFKPYKKDFRSGEELSPRAEILVYNLKKWGMIFIAIIMIVVVLLPLKNNTFRNAGCVLSTVLFVFSAIGFVFYKNWIEHSAKDNPKEEKGGD